MGAQLLHVGHEVPGRVLAQLRMGRGLSAAALVEEDDAIVGRIVEAAEERRDAAAGPAMEHDHGLSRRIAGLLEMQLVEV